METHELEIVIGTDGKVTMQVSGAKGPKCLDYVKLLQTIMGAEGDVQLTSEYYEDPGTAETRIDDQQRG